MTAMNYTSLHFSIFQYQSYDIHFLRVYIFLCSTINPMPFILFLVQEKKTIKNEKNICRGLCCFLCILQNDMLVVVVIYAHPLIMLIVCTGMKNDPLKKKTTTKKKQQTQITTHLLSHTYMKQP